MSIKENYFLNRNKELSSYHSTRDQLALREILTYKTLCKVANFNDNLDIDSGKFLDLGSGDQFLSKAVKQENFEYIPLDIDRVNFEIDSFPIESSSIDIIFCLALIEHIANSDLFLSECARVLKPGGNIYLSTPNFKYSYRSFYNDPTHIRPFTAISLQKQISFFFDKPIVFPNSRCKSENFYRSKFSFQVARYLPFMGSNKYMPSFLKGRATGIFCLATKKSMDQK
jgi:SAM-dependent methyltransferase